MGALANPSLESTYTGANRWLVRLLPSLTDFAFAFPVLWLFYVMNGTTTFLSDGDTGWHIRTGEWIWRHGAVPTTDLFSFTHPHGAWYAWEWLWDLLFAGVHHVGGLGAVAFVNVCLLGAVSVALFRLTRRTTDSDLISFACTVLAIATSSIHFLARPHLFTWLFVLGFAHAILSAKRGNWKALIPLPLYMVFWTNLHGGFFLGIFMLLIPAAGEIAGAFLHAQSFWDAAYQRSRAYLVAAFACALATFVNPYGWRLHSHILQYILDDRLIGQIGEYKSMDFHNILGRLFETMLLLALPAVLWLAMRKQYATSLGILCWAHIAIFASRNIPIFAFLAAPSIALMMQDLLGRLAVSRRIHSCFLPLENFAIRMRPLERASRLHLCSACMVLTLAAMFASEVPGFEGKFHKSSFPTSALSFVKSARFYRLFTTDTWASYFVYNLYPDQPSFVDGRSDFFGSDFMDSYAHVIGARWDWEQVLDQYSVDGIVLSPSIPVVTALKQSRNWHLLLDDGSAVVFRRAHAVLPSMASTGDSKVSSVPQSGRKKLGLLKPGLIVSSLVNLKKGQAND